MNPRIKCYCGYDRFKVHSLNTLECQRCERKIDIDPTVRCSYPNAADEAFDKWHDDVFKNMGKRRDG